MVVRSASALVCSLFLTLAVSVSSAKSNAPDAAPADASFVDGKWVGQGIFQLGEKVYNCPNSWQVFAGDSKTYQVRDAFVECDQNFKNLFTVISTFDLNPNGDLYFKDKATGEYKKTGEIRNNVLKTSFEQGGMENSIEIILNGPLMLYRDTMGKPGQMPMFSFVGIFQKVSQSSQLEQPTTR